MATIICVMNMLSAAAQDYPVIGQQAPEFRLSNVRHYSKKTFGPADAKGKWLILDFWEKGCVACVQAFPKLNELHREFGDQVQFMLVAKNDKKYNGDIESIFERYRKRLGLELPIAFDSAIFKRFGIQGVPHVIVIDPQTNVYAVTYGSFLNKENIQALIEKRTPEFERKYSTFEAGNSSRQVQWKYLVDEKSLLQEDFFYRSVLSRNQGELQIGVGAIDYHVDHGLYQVTGVNLPELYTIAYIGLTDWMMAQHSVYDNYWTYPVLEISDSSTFQFNYTDNTGFYNYSLAVPKEKATKAYLMKVMQNDLQNYFGFEVSMEVRMMPYWQLMVTEKAREVLKTKGDSPDFKTGPTAMAGKRITIENILSQIEQYNTDEHFPFLDETGLKEKIDISFNAVMTDMEDVRKALRKHGLLLEKRKKEFKVLVIRDPKPQDKNN